jgi:hypothetical protein
MSSSQVAVSGAIGCDFRHAKNQLILVQNSGQVSRLDLTRPLDSIVFSGTATIPADTSLSLNDGTSIHGGHIRWDHQPVLMPVAKLQNDKPIIKKPLKSATLLMLRPQASCYFSYLGQADYNSITSDELQDLPYSQQDFAASQIKSGDVFAVWNSTSQPASPFDCAKIQVKVTGTSLKVTWVAYKLKSPFTVLGTGYNNPRDIVVRSDEQTAYVTEQGAGAATGSLLRVNLTNANRAAATVIVSGLQAPQQMSLDETHNCVYTVESSNPGRLLQIDLLTGTKKVLLEGLNSPNGLLMSNDFQYAYISEQNGKVSRFTVSSQQRTVLAGYSNPCFLDWTDDTQTSILVPDKAVNQIFLLNMITVPPKTSLLVNNGPAPCNAVMVTATKMIVCCSTALYGYVVNVGLFNAGAPLLMGIGHVPVSCISRTLPVANPATDGYATTDPAYFFHVTDSPFGGSLAIMINHEQAWTTLKAKYYRLEVDGNVPQQRWSDYKWSSANHSFVLQSIGPSSAGYYSIRQPQEIWYNHWLGYILDTSGLANGLHTITLRLYSAESPTSEIGNTTQDGRSMVVQIDNRWPLVSIVQILHDGLEVKACETVDKGSHLFTFRIIATDPDQNILNWSMSAMWGNNQSKAVASDSYDKHISASKKWAGVQPGINDIVPAPPAHAWNAEVAGDSTSIKCAHTFYLGAWDRVINGWQYIHYADYHKSITLNLP